MNIYVYIYESLCIYVTATKLYFKRSKKNDAIYQNGGRI